MRQLDKYELGDEVGQGGMAVVYRALDTQLQRVVAIKVLHRHLASHPEARQRFEREAQATAKLRHPNIVEIYDYSGTDSEESYLVTELLEGPTLKQFITAHPPALPEVGVLMAWQVCRALVHAHGQGILHRDIKPENVMLGRDGVLKLMDFGIAQVVDAQRMTVTGQLLGSPAYMSPEHVDGKRLDFRTDVFSVGILLYQLSTGELPFRGRNPHETLKRIAMSEYADPRLVNPLVSDELEQVLRRALARNPDDRTPSAARLLEELERLLASVGIDDPAGEFEHYFKDPVASQAALRARVLHSLFERGASARKAGQLAEACRALDRVLVLSPGHAGAQAELRAMRQRSRIRLGLLAGTAIAALAVSVLAWSAARESVDGAVGRRPANAGGVDARGSARGVSGVGGVGEQESAGVVSGVGGVGARSSGAVSLVGVPGRAEAVDASPTERIMDGGGLPNNPGADAGEVADLATAGATPVELTTGQTTPRPRTGVGAARPSLRPTLRPGVVTPPPVIVVPRTVRVLPSLKSVTCSIDGGAFAPLSRGAVDVAIAGIARTVVCRHPRCLDARVQIPPDARDSVSLRMEFRPTRIIPSCKGAEAISVDGRVAAHGAAIEVTQFQDNGSQRLTVDFVVDGNASTKVVDVVAGAPPKKVLCAP